MGWHWMVVVAVGNAASLEPGKQGHELALQRETLGVITHSAHLQALCYREMETLAKTPR